jgi:spore coat protein U-like protein
MSIVHHTRTASACLRLLAAGSALAAGIVLAPSGAQAATATDTMTVTATVQSACILTANPLAFGNYNPTSSANVDASTTVLVTCTQGTAYNVGLGAGAGSGATTTTRKLTSSGHTLNYTLYQDASRSINWGNTVATDTVSATAGLTATTHTVYGRIAGSQNTTAGSYTDSVTVTVTY